MLLVVAAQDIAAITFGLVDGEHIKEEKTVETSPEGYLAAFEQVFKQWSVVSTDIETIIVVTGPGSFTASRVSTTLANGLGFAWNVPVIGVENPLFLPLKNIDELAHKASMNYATPTYDRPPEITVSKNAHGDNARA